MGGFLCAQGTIRKRLFVDPTIVLMLMAQVVRGRELALAMARTIGEEEVRERNTNYEANNNAAPCSNRNKAAEQGT